MKNIDEDIKEDIGDEKNEEIDDENLDNCEAAMEAIQWEKFKEFAEEEGINTDDSEDYETWLKCFKLGWRWGNNEGQF